MNTRQKNRPFKSKALFTIAGGVVLIHPALAQEAAPVRNTELEEVVVTGMREALQQSMEVKRDAVGVVDAITAEDIGKFPDTNLAESLQRIPGVSIDRSNGEGSEVTVRGFGPGFNLVTLNGRTVATAEVDLYGNRDNYSGGQGRSFDFSNIAAESVSGIEVYKTGQAVIPSGGIGATINIKTRRPFDTPGTQMSVAAKGLYDTTADSDTITPELSGLFSWTNSGESFGISLFGAYQKRESGAAIGQTNDWVVNRASNIMGNTAVVRAGGNPANYINMPADGELFAIPQDSRYDWSDLDKERINGQAVVQFRPTDSMTMTVDYLHVDSKTRELRAEQTNWFATPFDHLTFTQNDALSYATYMQENNNGEKDMGFEQTYRQQKDTMDSVGFNLEWEVNDTGTLRFDAHMDNAESSPDNPLGHSATFVTIAAPIISQHSLSWDNGDHFPVQSFTFDDSFKGNGNGVIDVGDLGTQVARSATNSQEMDVEEFDLRYTLKIDNSRLDFGGNYRGTKIKVDSGSTQMDLGTWGVSNPRDVELYAPGVVEAFCLSCRFDDYPVGQAQTAFRGDATRLYSILTPIYGGQGNTLTVNSAHNEVEENITSFYAQFRVDTEFLNRPVTVSGGLRYEMTEVDATALQTVPTGIRWTADNDFVFIYGSSELQNVTDGTRYDHLLPNIDFKLNLTDELIGRLAYSQTIARAPYGNLFASVDPRTPNNPTALGGQTLGFIQDPGLLPLESENFDVSVEWYYGNDSYVSLGFFDKKVKNFLGTGVFTQPLFGLTDPSSGADGTRSGSAITVLDTLAVDRSPANLFTMVALIDANGGDVAAAQAEFQSHLVNGALPQGYVDQILGQYDVVADGSDPEMQFRVEQPINKDGHIYGFELAFQHFFGSSGFGVAGSYTIVDGDVKANPGSDPNENQFALIGLSDTANLTLMYENYGFSARLAYNWRDKFLNANNQGGSRSPQFTEDYGQIDATVSYDLNDHFQVQVEGINLTGEDHREYRRLEGMTMWAYELGPRYALGARYKF